MKRLMLLCFAFISLVCLNLVDAQIKTPQPSPFAKMSQDFGLSSVEMEYSRPSVKGRTIFSKTGLVPYGAKWRAGANACTKISFGSDVNFGGKEVKKGQYALYIEPSEGAWKVYLYSDVSNWGLPKEWEEDKVAATVEVKADKMPMSIETLMFVFDNISADKMDLNFLWSDVFFIVPISSKVTEVVEKSIEATLNGPSSRDYYTAGRWYLDNNKNLDKAVEYLQIANKKDPKFWSLRQESLALAKVGKKKEAIAVAKKSLEMATIAGNKDYIKMNKESIAKWMKI